MSDDQIQDEFGNPTIGVGPFWDLWAMLHGFRKWDGERVAAEFRSLALKPGGEQLSAILTIADLIEGKGRNGMKLKLIGSDKRRFLEDIRAEHDRYIEIGRWVQAEVDEGEQVRSALAGAEDEFGVSESTAQRALSIFRERRERLDNEGKWYPLPTIRKRRTSRPKKP